MSRALLERRLDAAARAGRPRRVGTVASVVGLGIEVVGLDAAIGDLVSVGAAGTPAEVVALTRDRLRCMPLGRLDGLRVGDPATLAPPARVPVGRALLGRVIDGRGRPIDGLGPLRAAEADFAGAPPSALDRARIDTPLHTGVRVLDTLTPIGRGQRIGLFAGSGVGKSSLLSMVARGTEAEVSVIALIGERGREVREFIEDDLGPEGLARSIVVVSTSDEPAVVRMRGAQLATRIAESFRDEGRHVVLMMDSLTRVAMAQREIGLSVGEPPATRGYPPSTFAMLARLLERAGTDRTGSITGIYTVLVDGDDHNEPIADSARSILDGHIVLERSLAVAGHFPAVDALASVSRLASKVTSRERLHDVAAVRAALAARTGVQDLLDIGAYSPGANPLVDRALANADGIDALLRQRIDEPAPSAEAWAQLASLARRLEAGS